MKHSRTKATDIPRWVKDEVYERDGWCVICGAAGLPEAHYIRRSAGGLGIPKNIFTACRECHEEFDHGNEEHREKVREYLMEIYPDWNEAELFYQKWPEELRLGR